MLSKKTVFVLIGTLIFLIAAFALGGQTAQSTRDQNNSPFHMTVAQEKPSHAVHARPCNHPDHVHHAAHADLDSIARADMNRYAAHHLHGAVARPHTFHAVRHWSREWELRWIDYDVSHRLVRIYHAVHRTEPSLRFTSRLHHADGRYERWQPVE